MSTRVSLFVIPFTTVLASKLAVLSRGAVLTLDGKLDEAAWAKADSIVLKFNSDTLLIPGSGYGNWENPTTDPTNATIKFLVVGNYLWIGVDAKDASIGGSSGWERWDCLFMNIKNKKSTDRPTPALETLVKWMDITGVGQNAAISGWAPAVDFAHTASVLFII